MACAVLEHLSSAAFPIMLPAAVARGTRYSRAGDRREGDCSSVPSFGEEAEMRSVSFERRTSFLSQKSQRDNKRYEECLA
jgi:hypothetical protein